MATLRLANQIARLQRIIITFGMSVLGLPLVMLGSFLGLLHNAHVGAVTTCHPNPIPKIIPFFLSPMLSFSFLSFLFFYFVNNIINLLLLNFNTNLLN